MTSLVARRGWRWPIVALLTFSLAGCFNNETLFHGARYSRDGKTLELASLMPSCSCTTVSSKVKNDILLVSRLHGIQMGELLLKPDDPVRFRFDWAGPSTEDTYQITAYDYKGGARGAEITGLKDQLHVDPDISSISCNSSSCPFGALSMNHAWAEQLGQSGAEMYDVGVSMMHAGKSMAANTMPGTCGCMMLRNTSSRSVELRARLHGRDRGLLVFPPGEMVGIGFDYAGDNPDDVYIVDALLEGADPNAPNQSSNAPLPAAPGSAKRTTAGNESIALTLSDYVQIVGQINGVECPHSGASETDSVRLALNGAQVLCPFGPLRMNERLTGVNGALMPAPAPGGNANPTSVAKRNQ